MREALSREVGAPSLAFLSLFYARSHRRLYVPQWVGEFGTEIGLSMAEAVERARLLARKGYLEELGLGEDARGPLMQITASGISAARAACTIPLREELESSAE